MFINNNLNKINPQQIVMEPPLYFAQQHIWNVCFHPFTEVLACSEITGQIEILKYSSDDVVPLIKNSQLHRSSVRFCTFNQSGNLLASCGEDKRLGFLDGNGEIAHIIKKAHPSPIYRCKFMNDHTLISGDDDGLIKVWDLRTATPVFQAQEQNDQITGFAFSEKISQYQIYASCSNGTVAGYDLRQNSDSLAKLIMLSDSVDEELSGIQIIKDGKFIVVSSSEGSLVIFKREQLEHHFDRIQGHPGSIDALEKIDENTVITGCQDGFIRGIGIYPKVQQVLGQHEEEENFPIQSLSISHCRRFMASSSHDQSINFYDINQYVKKRSEIKAQSFEQQSLENNMDMEESQNQSKIWEMKKQNNSSEYEDQDEDSDSSEQKEIEEISKKKKNRKITVKARKFQIQKESTKNFFKGL